MTCKLLFAKLLMQETATTTKTKCKLIYNYLGLELFGDKIKKECRAGDIP